MKRVLDGQGREVTPEIEALLASDQADDTPEAARLWVREQQAAARHRLFEASVPERFRAASYADLDQQLQARDVVAGWLDTKSRTLLLVGNVGTGKTHAAYAVLRDAATRGMWVAGATVSGILRSLRPDADPSPLPRRAELADLFLFDDLAAERGTEWAIEQVGEIVDQRHREQRRQIVTTNASRDELTQHLGQRVVSRLLDAATLARFDGPDRRVSW